MKKYLSIIVIAIVGYLHSDVAPNPIFLNGIINADSTKIQMVSEVVIANVYKDTALVECNFVLKNNGCNEKISCGFPVMSFYHWWPLNDWKPEKENFKVWIDNIEVLNYEKFIPDNILIKKAQMDSLYPYYSEALKNICDSLSSTYPKLSEENWDIFSAKVDNALKAMPLANEYVKLDNELSFMLDYDKTPWYLWDMEVDSLETVYVKVTYKVPSGLGYGANYRYFKYIIHTGSGWHKKITNANIIVKLNNIDIETIEEISPENSIIDSLNKTITWDFSNIEPKVEDDIYIRFYDLEERKKYEKYQRDWERKRKWYFLNYLNPIYWMKQLYYAIFW